MEKYVTWQNHSATAKFKILKEIRSYLPSVNVQKQPPEVFNEISKNTFFTEDLWTTTCEFDTEMLIFRSSSSRSQMFFKTNVFKLKTLQYWSFFLIKLQTFFYRTPTVAISEVLWQQIFFCSWIWYLLLTVARVFALDSFEKTS